MIANKQTISPPQDHRWTVHDKIRQYKGIVKLLYRQKNLEETEILRNQKKQQKEIHNLKRTVKIKRQELHDQCFNLPSYGVCIAPSFNPGEKPYKQRNLLCMNLPIIKFITNLQELNSSLRDKVDALNYHQKQTIQLLLDSKLYVVELEKSIILIKSSENTSKQILVKIQGILSKQQVAFRVRNNLLSIFDLLRTDAIYFNSILNGLDLDVRRQINCFYQILRLEQSATNGLRICMENCIVLEQNIRRSKKETDENIQQIHDEISHFKLKIIKIDSIAKKDAPIDFTFTKPDDTEAIKLELDDINEELKRISRCMSVSNVENILERLKDIAEQNVRLKDLIQASEKNRDTLLKLKNRCNLVRNLLTYSEKYVDPKLTHESLTSISKNIETFKSRRETTLDTMKHISLDCRISCYRLIKMLEFINHTSSDNLSLNQDRYNYEDSILNGEVDDLLNFMIAKYQRLLQNTKDLVDSKTHINLNAAKTNFERELIKISILKQENEPRPSDTPLVEEYGLLQAYAVTRNDIKQRSKQIVLANINEDDFYM